MVGTHIWVGHSLKLLPQCNQQLLPCVPGRAGHRQRGSYPENMWDWGASVPEMGWKWASQQHEKVHLCKGHNRSAVLQFSTLTLFSRVLPVSSVLAPAGPPVKLQQENSYSLSGSCSPLFQACVADWKYKRHWWTVSVLTSKEIFLKLFWSVWGSIRTIYSPRGMHQAFFQRISASHIFLTPFLAVE